MASRGRGARIKGAQFERDIAKLLTEQTGHEFKRGLGQTRAGGQEVPDVYSEDLPLHIECKRQKKCSIKAAMQQALDDCGAKLPIVITKDDHKSALVTMQLGDWVLFLQEYINR